MDVPLPAIWHQDKSLSMGGCWPGNRVNFAAARADLADLHGVLLSHLQVDHSAGLPALIKGSYFTQRTDNLVVYGPSANELMPSTSDFIQRLLDNRVPFPIYAISSAKIATPVTTNAQ